jgi:hypothetical protein
VQARRLKVNFEFEFELKPKLELELMFEFGLEPELGRNWKNSEAKERSI